MSRDYTAEPPSLAKVHDGNPACYGADTDEFYPDKGQALDPIVKATCLGRDDRPACPVLEDCRHYALHHETYGTWGGLSAGELRGMRRDLGIRLGNEKAEHARSQSPGAVQKRAERARAKEQARQQPELVQGEEQLSLDDYNLDEAEAERAAA